MTHNLALDRFYSLEPRRFGFMERLELWRYSLPDDSPGLALTLIMSGATPARLRLDFQNVRDLKIGRLEHNLTWFLEIRSIRDHQLEELNYRVVESEEDSISFYCADFQARLASEE
jgi:hypothetical protein